MKKFIGNSILLGISLVPCGLALEFLLPRLMHQSSFLVVDGKPWTDHYKYDPLTGYSLQSNIKDEYRDIYTNGFGNRTTKRPFDSTKESIVIIGDSTVFGWGAKNSETFPYLLSKDDRFNCFNIVNLGVPSYSLANIKNTIKFKAKNYNPRLVITSILWPWEPFNNSFYGPEPRKDWAEINHSFYREKMGSSDGFKDSYFFGRNTLQIARHYLGKTKRYAYDLLTMAKKNNASPPEGRRIRPGIRSFTLNHQEEIAFANQHIDQFREAENLSELPQEMFRYYVHPYAYTIKGEHEGLGAAGAAEFHEKIGALSLKELINKLYPTLDLAKVYFDGSHLTTKGNALWKDLIVNHIVEDSGLSCPSEQ